MLQGVWFLGLDDHLIPALVYLDYRVSMYMPIFAYAFV